MIPVSQRLRMLCDGLRRIGRALHHLLHTETGMEVLEIAASGPLCDREAADSQAQRERET